MNEGPQPSEPYSQPGPPQRVRVQIPSVTPYVTYILLGVTILVFILQLASKTLLGYDLPVVLGVKANEYIVLGQVWRLITPIFLHGSILHIAFNMYSLFILGPGLERIWGHGRFAALYFLAGFTGNVVSFAMSPATSAGSSTAIFGLLAAQGVFLYQNRKIFAAQARSAITQLIFVALINLGIGLSPGSNIDNWGHLGGLLGGLVFSWMASPLFSVSGLAPDYRLEDHREQRDIVLGAGLVLLAFGGLAAWLILTRGGYISF